MSHFWFTDGSANGLIPVRQNWRWGFINYQGKFVIKPPADQYDWLLLFN
ncbi:WG repeat-containing protein [Paenibacillus pabuli]